MSYGVRDAADAEIDYPFLDVEDLARACELNQHDLQALARANALAGLAGHRRQTT